MSVSLKGQVALVVGASSGIGRETAVLFAREGARVVASARRGDRLRSLQDELAKEGHSIEISPADASNATEMKQLAQRTRAHLVTCCTSKCIFADKAEPLAKIRVLTGLWDQ